MRPQISLFCLVNTVLLLIVFRLRVARPDCVPRPSPHSFRYHTSALILR